MWCIFLLKLHGVSGPTLSILVFEDLPLFPRREILEPHPFPQNSSCVFRGRDTPDPVERAAHLRRITSCSGYRTDTPTARAEGTHGKVMDLIGSSEWSGVSRKWVRTLGPVPHESPCFTSHRRGGWVQDDQWVPDRHHSGQRSYGVLEEIDEGTSPRTSGNSPSGAQNQVGIKRS